MADGKKRVRKRSERIKMKIFKIKDVLIFKEIKTGLGNSDEAVTCQQLSDTVHQIQNSL